jgi:hypothetical protein
MSEVSRWSASLFGMMTVRKPFRKYRICRGVTFFGEDYIEEFQYRFQARIPTSLRYNVVFLVSFDELICHQLWCVVVDVVDTYMICIDPVLWRS